MHNPILRSQRMSPLTGRTAATLANFERQAWAVQGTTQECRKAANRCAWDATEESGSDTCIDYGFAAVRIMGWEKTTLNA